ncbi:hypothetical protein BDR05DRAFT_951423 [Suillus weaverae]|nr:hypothetical protein BDR05DRAFT_951423 [Suillus weaverae]
MPLLLPVSLVSSQTLLVIQLPLIEGMVVIAVEVVMVRVTTPTRKNPTQRHYSPSQGSSVLKPRPRNSLLERKLTLLISGSGLSASKTIPKPRLPYPKPKVAHHPPHPAAPTRTLVVAHVSTPTPVLAVTTPSPSVSEPLTELDEIDSLIHESKKMDLEAKAHRLGFTTTKLFGRVLIIGLVVIDLLMVLLFLDAMNSMNLQPSAASS